MALYHSSRIVVFGVLIFGIMMVGITCVSLPLFRVNHRGLIIHKWTLLTGHRSTFINATGPGCHYIMSEQSYVHRHDTRLFRRSHTILYSAIRTFHVLRAVVQI
jgi:hypothetical protein